MYTVDKNQITNKNEMYCIELQAIWLNFNRLRVVPQDGHASDEIERSERSERK